jgi:hypothetical protein
MKRRHWIYFAAFLFGLGPGIQDLYYRLVLRRYRTPENHGAVLLARGYAREYEQEHGHRPTIEELAAYATQRFNAAVDADDMFKE